MSTIIASNSETMTYKHTSVTHFITHSIVNRTYNSSKSGKNSAICIVLSPSDEVRNARTIYTYRKKKITHCGSANRADNVSAQKIIFPWQDVGLKAQNGIPHFSQES